MARRHPPEKDNESTLSRRNFLLGASLLAGGSLLVDLSALAKSSTEQETKAAFPGGRLVRILPFAGEQTIPFGQVYGTGLDARQITDLSALTPDSLITPVDKFYIRTACSDLIDYSKPWTIQLKVSSADVRTIPIEKLQKMSQDMGLHLMECSGNERVGQFGLMSACSWQGVPVLQFLKSMKVRSPSGRICISGFDKYSEKPSEAFTGTRSYPGASWIFTMDQIKSTGAFLATGMNGKPLTRDHGYPVRLVMPGWYGCTCIKWVNEIWFPDDNAESTSQMREFAGRTHQDGVHALARDYKPSSIDQSAMPIRVEQWDVDGKPKYNVAGIMWGGHTLTRDLQIRFSPDEAFVPVENIHHSTNATWTLWNHTWTPTKPGLYRIQLKIADPSIPTKRLDKGYYARAVEITNV